MWLRISVLLAALAAATGAWAQNVALIYGDRGQAPFFQGLFGAQTDAFVDVLTDAGFEVIEPADRSADNLRRAAPWPRKALSPPTA